MESSNKSLYFAQIQDAPADPIYAIVSAYEADQSPKKVDLGVGAYRDEQARPWILPSIRKVHDQTTTQLVLGLTVTRQKSCFTTIAREITNTCPLLASRALSRLLKL